jgi:hypothetical protein
VHNAFVSNRPRKRVFQNGADERGVAKIECLSPRCILEAVVYVNLGTGDWSPLNKTRTQVCSKKKKRNMCSTGFGLRLTPVGGFKLTHMQ